MKTYYVAGLPYSDELCHYGILGQKWGVRRFQNSDGSLTPEGRERYGVKSERGEAVRKAFAGAGRAIGSAGRSVGKAVGNAGRSFGNAARSFANRRVQNYKRRHPNLMTDQELQDYTNRLLQEKKVSDLRREMRSSSRGREFVGDIMRKGTSTLADAAFRRIANNIAETKTNKALKKVELESKKQDLEARKYDLETRRKDEATRRRDKDLDYEIRRFETDAKKRDEESRRRDKDLDYEIRRFETDAKKQDRKLERRIDKNLRKRMKEFEDVMDNGSASDVRDAMKDMGTYLDLVGKMRKGGGNKKK